jgi:hypothetical protein
MQQQSLNIRLPYQLLVPANGATTSNTTASGAVEDRMLAAMAQAPNSPAAIDMNTLSGTPRMATTMIWQTRSCHLTRLINAITLHYIASIDNIAKIITTSLPMNQFVKLRCLIKMT